MFETRCVIFEKLYRRFRMIRLCHSQLIVTVGSYVPHPRQRLVPTFFNNLQISNLDSTDSEVWNLKLYTDGGLPSVFSLPLAISVNIGGSDGR